MNIKIKIYKWLPVVCIFLVVGCVTPPQQQAQQQSKTTIQSKSQSESKSESKSESESKSDVEISSLILKISSSKINY